MSDKVRSKIVWYSQRFYGTTGDKLEDLKIVLGDDYITTNWYYTTAIGVLFDNFYDLFKGNIIKILDMSVFKNSDNSKEEVDYKKEVLLALLSVIELSNRQIFKEFLDEKYKYLYDLNNLGWTETKISLPNESSFIKTKKGAVLLYWNMRWWSKIDYISKIDYTLISYVPKYWKYINDDTQGDDENGMV